MTVGGVIVENMQNYDRLLLNGIFYGDDPIKCKAALEALRKTTGIKVEELGENKIKVIY